MLTWFVFVVYYDIHSGGVVNFSLLILRGVQPYTVDEAEW